MTRSTGEVTRLLKEWRDGNTDALNQLLPLVYAELRRIAAGRLRRERTTHSIEATALVHEAYLRLVAQDVPDWHDRVHFFAIAARLMRQILTDRARTRKAGKRGGGQAYVPLDEISVSTVLPDDRLLALDEALERLGALDEQQCKIVELRFFAGLSIDETAEALGISAATVNRDWAMAKSWLSREIEKQ
jgi:RNA polymerase sigma-70 factor (ECF subfamily)